MTNKGNDDRDYLRAAAAALLDTRAGREALRNLSADQQQELTRAADRVWNPYQGKHKA